MAMGKNVGQVDHVVMMCHADNLVAATDRLAEMRDSVRWGSQFEETSKEKSDG